MTTATQIAEANYKPIIDGYDYFDLSDDGGTWEPASRGECLKMAGIGFIGMFVCLFIAALAFVAFGVTPSQTQPTTIATTR